jgi:hypothetical protein
MKPETDGCERAREAIAEHMVEASEPWQFVSALHHLSSCADCGRFVAGLRGVVGATPAQPPGEGAMELPETVRRHALDKWSRPTPRAHPWRAVLTTPRALLAGAFVCLALLLVGLGLGVRPLLPAASADARLGKSVGTSYNMRSSAVWQLCDTTQHNRVFGARL